MFINCRHCNALVATDPATDLPPERCPRCAGVLLLPAAANGAAAKATRPVVAQAAPARGEPPAAAAPAAGQDRSGEVPLAARLVVHDHVPAADMARPRTAEAEVARPASVSIATASVVADAAVPPAGGRAGPADPAGTGGNTATAEPDTAVPAPPEARLERPGTPASLYASAAPGTAADPVPRAPAPTPAPESPSAGDATAVATTSPSPDTSEAPADAAAVTPAPAFGGRRGTRAARNLRAWRQPAALAGLLVLLGLQIVLADRERLAADAQWRPLVSGLCGVLGCSVPPWREPQAFVLLAREVRPHPQRAGVLRASASFRNDARWPQPWPELALTLSDLDGRAVAARVFTPDEYLGAAPASPLLGAGQSVDIALDIQEPSSGTVSYAWDLR